LTRIVKHNMRVILNAASSIDGKIATWRGDTKISSESDLRRVHILRSQVDAILVGITTVIKDDPLLNVRRVPNRIKIDGTTSSILKTNPIRIIVDGKAKISLHSTIVKTANQIETRIAVTKNAQDPEKHGRVDLKKLLEYLERDGVSKILVEGGGEINWSLIRNNLFDELIITISPLIIGGKKATSLVGGKGYDTITECAKVKLTKIQKKNTGEIVLYYNNISKGIVKKKY
jgi:2,5-diamino-6-(ribosylamino)-4(3H)-pyrimidinone 5'-phosphate reductase